MEDNAGLKELRKITKILTLANASIIEKELEKIAGTNERKKIWVLMDGKLMPTELAKEVGVSAMAVSKFLNAGKLAELINYDRGKPPERALEYIPPTWIDLLKLTQEETPKEEKNENESTTGEVARS